MQPTTIPVHTCSHQRAPPQVKHYRNGYHGAVDVVLSDDTVTEYEYRYGTERSFSDESGSTRLPCHYENDDESCRRVSRSAYSSDRSYGRRAKERVPVHKDPRKVYPQQYASEGAVYQEIPPQAM